MNTQNPPGLERYDELAQSVALAYVAGDAQAIRRINEVHGTSFLFDREPERTRARLPAWFASSERSPEMALADAQQLVARTVGFDTWHELVQSLRRTRRVRGSAPEVARFYRIDAATNTIAVRGPLAARHWDVVLATVRERGLSGVVAPGIEDEALARVCRVPGLRRLVLGARVTDAGMRHLAKVTGLEELELGGVHGVSDRGLLVLRQLPNLKRFQACWARGISDTGVANLGACDALEEVDLMGTQTGDGALEALQGKHRLLRLKTGTHVSDRSLPLLQTFPAFKASNCGEPAFELMSFSARTTHLMLDGSFTDLGLTALAGLDGLVGLSFFRHCQALTSAALALLPLLAGLRFLGCPGTLCDDAAMRHIGAAAGLRMLMGQGAVATDVGFAELARSSTLEYFWGRDCPNLGGAGLKALAKMPALKGLAVSLKRVDDGALSVLPSFPALRSLVPIDVSDDGFRHVGRCTALENLWCMYCRETGDVATAHVRGLSSLKTYYAGQTKITDSSLEILAGLLGLEKIELWDVSGVTDAGIAALARLPRLRKLVVDGSPAVTRAAFAACAPAVDVTLA